MLVETYITLEEANNYIAEYYTSTDPLRIQWEAMSDDDKEVYLRKSFAQINELPYVGRPKNINQPYPFPRCENWKANDMQRVKYAQAEQSIFLTDAVIAQEVNDRIRLRRAGVVEYRIGDLQEKFQSGLPANSNANFFGLSEKAYSYLSKWLQGGYKVCTSIKKPCGTRKMC